MPDVLVLDMNYRPVGFKSWQDAVKNIWEDRAIVVKEDESGKMLRSPSFEMGMPRVIRVKNAWMKRRKTAVPFSRRNIYIRDNGECQYCGKHLKLDEYTLDHVIKGVLVQLEVLAAVLTFAVVADVDVATRERDSSLPALHPSVLHANNTR